jgi:hypothetical protein
MELGHARSDNGRTLRPQALCTPSGVQVRQVLRSAISQIADPSFAACFVPVEVDSSISPANDLSEFPRLLLADRLLLVRLYQRHCSESFK